MLCLCLCAEAEEVDSENKVGDFAGKENRAIEVLCHGIPLTLSGKAENGELTGW